MRRVNRHPSLFAALLSWALLSVLAAFIMWGLRDRARLIRDNDNERIFNTLFAGLRDYDDYGSAIEGSEILRQRIAGFAVYDNSRELIQSWGKVPPRFDDSLLDKKTPRRFNRYTIPDRRGAAVRFIIHNERPFTPQRQAEPRREMPMHGSGSRMPGIFNNGYVYIDIRHPAYWRAITITDILYPFIVLVLLGVSLAVRRLYVRNLDYRERIEAQEHLVVLGTAASTLAHEIKNPLHSIKLQTGILKKTPGAASGAEELSRIDEEVDRLSALTYRVNDYLRDAKGNPQDVDIAALIGEIAERLGRTGCGRAIPVEAEGKPFVAFIDSNRARSVFENIITNALESGGPQEQCGVSLGLEGGIAVSIFDRGRGVTEADLGRVFDPFFTTKSSGTGIGLAISKRFVEAAGGTITLENRRGGGALAKVTLPRKG